MRAKYALVWPQLQEMRHLAALLKRAAEKRGTMDLISVETRFILDEEGKPAALLPRQSGEAEGMIEQFMIAANVAVAALAAAKSCPSSTGCMSGPIPKSWPCLWKPLGPWG